MQFDLSKLLFFDVETVPQHGDLSSLPKEQRKLWDFYYETFKERVTDKSRLSGLDLDTESYKKEVYRQTAALFPEFGKVCCISLAFIQKDGKIKMESFYGGDNEIKILEEVRTIFNRVNNLSFNICGHNIKNFDVPFLSKRYIINGLNPPESFPKWNTKPWETSIIDTKEIWNSGSLRGLSSLDTVCTFLEIDSPKTGDVKGDNVYHYFWELSEFEKIKDYCEKDVKSLVDIIVKLNNLK